jgi:hypothetical protein
MPDGQEVVRIMDEAPRTWVVGRLPLMVPAVLAAVLHHDVPLNLAR